MNKRGFIIWGVIISFFTAIPIGIYIGQFKDSTLSNNPADWGTFGDYFGGVLNAFFSLLTLIATAYIAFKISNLEDDRSKKALQFDRIRFLNELRANELRRILSELSRIDGVLFEFKSFKEHKFESIARMRSVRLEFRSFVSNSAYLFPILDNSKNQEMLNRVDQNIVVLISYLNNDIQELTFENIKEVMEKTNEMNHNLSLSIEELSGTLGRYILEEMDVV